MTASRFDWETIRAEYETGSTMGQLAKRHGVDKSTISKRAKKEGWTQDISGAVDRLTVAKINGLGNTVDPKKRAAALEQAADARAAVISRHKDEWNGFTKQFAAARGSGDFEELKKAKITAETMRIKQEGERKAWGIADKVSTEVDMSGNLDVATTLLEARARVARLR